MSDLAERFWSKVAIAGPDKCWEWQASKHKGYGCFGNSPREGRSRRAHRVAYKLLVGPIPERLTIDHLCRNRACQNPDHLEPVTNRDNVLRSEGITAKNAQKTHCKHGHEFTPSNTIRRKGGRECRACQRERESRRVKASQSKFSLAKEGT